QTPVTHQHMFTSVPTLGALRSRAIYSVSVLSLFAALTAPAQIKPESPVSENTVELSVFRVSGERDYGYRKQSTVTTSRVALKVVENPQAVEIISGELLQDLALTIPSQAFRYTSSVIVGENESMQAGIYTMRGFQLPMFNNGLAIASVGASTDDAVGHHASNSPRVRWLLSTATRLPTASPTL
ncbi:MAG: hypothetical protein LC114_21470, partial [Bryobacterales bacterium]|nr:hypothetical protein [Bryobacterales bacterium]